MKRKSMPAQYSLCVQSAFIIGTTNEDGTPNFAPITWVSVTNVKGDDYLLVVSMFGTKQTKKNVIRSGKLSVNLVSRDTFSIELTTLDPIIYSGQYHSIGEHLGGIGDFGGK